MNITVHYKGQVTTAMLLSNLLRVMSSSYGNNYSQAELDMLAAIKPGETITIGLETFTAGE